MNTPGGTLVECWTEDPKVPGSNTDQDKTLSTVQINILPQIPLTPELNT